TTEIKSGLIDQGGRLVAATRAPHAIEIDALTGRAEQDPDAWWDGLRTIVRGLVAGRTGGEARDVAAICVVGQGPTLVPVAVAGRATHPAITWMDTRPASEAPALEAATGLSGWGLGILPAGRWLERHDPSAAERTRWYLN